MRTRYKNRSFVGQRPIKVHIAASNILDRAQSDIEKRVGFKPPRQRIASKAVLAFKTSNLKMTYTQFHSLTHFTETAQRGVKITDEAMRHLLKERKKLSHRWDKLNGQIPLAKLITVIILQSDYALLTSLDPVSNPDSEHQLSATPDTTPPAEAIDPSSPPASP